MTEAKAILWTRGDRFYPIWPFPNAAPVPYKLCGDQRYATDWGQVERCGREHGHPDDKHASYGDGAPERPVGPYSHRVPFLVWQRSMWQTLCANCGDQIEYDAQNAEWMARDEIRADMFVNVCNRPGGHKPVNA